MPTVNLLEPKFNLIDHGFNTYIKQNKKYIEQKNMVNFTTAALLYYYTYSCVICRISTGTRDTNPLKIKLGDVCNFSLK